MMSLFCRLADPDCLRPIRYSESDYSYFSVSGRPEVQRIRAVLEGWYSTYPECPRKQSLKREIESSEGDFLPPFFELLLYQTFTALGCNVNPEPDPGNGVMSRPDFLVQTPSGGEFYCEAVHSTGKSFAQVGKDKLFHTLIDQINEKLVTPRFSWIMSNVHQAVGAPSGKQVAHQLRKYEETLDWEAIVANGDRNLDNLKLTVTTNGWSIDFQPVPRKKETWNRAGARPIGGQIGNAMFSLTSDQIREEVRLKRRQHVGIDKPLVVAVNSGQLDVDTEDIFNALYGTESYLVSRSQENEPLRVSRALDGIWLGKEGPKHGHIPFVLVGKHMTPWGYDRQSLDIFPNPYIERVEALEPPNLARWDFSGGKGQYFPGVSLGELLGVP